MHLIGCQELDDGYGWELTVEFHAYLRDLIRFHGLETLTAQIQRDVARARTLLGDPSECKESHPVVVHNQTDEPARSGR